MRSRLLPQARALGALLQHLDAGESPRASTMLEVPQPPLAPLWVSPAPSSAAPTPPGKGQPVTLQFIPARPTLPAGCRIAGHYEQGVLAISSHPPLEVPVDNAWGPALTANISAATVGQADTAQVEGWLTAYGMPVLSLRWLPRSWWDDHHSGPALVGRIWEAIAPESQAATNETHETHETHETAAPRRANVAEPAGHVERALPESEHPTPPQQLRFTGEAAGDALHLQVNGSWVAPHGEAQVAQHIALSPEGDYTPGPGTLAWAGSIPALSQFVDHQLLPLLGEAPVQHPGAAHPSTEPVRAHAAWDPRGPRLQLRAHLHHPRWRLQGAFTRDAAASQFAVRFEGSLAEFSRAVEHARLPSLCQIDDIAGWVASGRALASDWSRSSRAWEAADATLTLRGETTEAQGVQGEAQLAYRHGPWIDHLTGRIGPPSPPRPARLPALIDEGGPLELVPGEPQAPPLHLLHGLANFFTGGPMRVSSDSLRALGAWTPPSDVRLSLRRYTQPTPVAPVSPWSMPTSALGSLLGLWRGRSAKAALDHPAASPAPRAQHVGDA